jgi:transposase InsO family protein
MAKENPTWGYERIQGALQNLGFKLSDTTVGSILREHGIEPAPDRGKRTTWRTFLRAHWEVLGAADFTTVEAWTRKGLVTYYVLVVIKLSSRRVEIAGITPNPDGDWVQQAGRTLVDTDEGFLLDTKYLLLDRDKKFLPFAGVLKSAETDVVFLPPRSPNLNAFIERFMRSMKSECLSKMVFFGENSLRRALTEFEKHYHHERNHQGLENNIIDFRASATSADSSIQCRERLGGMLRYYHRDAA